MNEPMPKGGSGNLGPISFNLIVEALIPLGVISERFFRLLSKCHKLGQTFGRSGAGNEPNT